MPVASKQVQSARRRASGASVPRPVAVANLRFAVAVDATPSSGKKIFTKDNEGNKVGTTRTADLRPPAIARAKAADKKADLVVSGL